MFFLIYFIIGVIISLLNRFVLEKGKVTIGSFVSLSLLWPAVLITWFFTAEFWEKEI